MKNAGLVLALILGATVSAQAEESQSTDTQNKTKVKLEQVKKDSGAKKEDIDQEITNARMRAEAGSKRMLSMQLGLGYVGGTFTQPFGRTRPALTAGDPDQSTAVSGSISARYRLTKNDSVGLGVGVAWISPFQNNPWKTRPGKKTKASELSSPGLDYNRAFKWGKLQNSVGASVSYATSRYAADDKHYYMGYGLSWNMLTNPIPSIPLTIGLGNGFGYQTFKDEEMDGQAKSSFGINPYLEYAFSDKVNFRTVFRPWIYAHYRSEPTSAFVRSPYTQSVGLGVSLTRDVYFYPNFQFQPRAISEGVIDTKATNVGISTIINL